MYYNVLLKARCMISSLQHVVFFSGMAWYGMISYRMVQNLTLNWCLGQAGEAQCTHKPSGPETLSLVEHTLLCWKKH